MRVHNLVMFTFDCVSVVLLKESSQENFSYESESVKKNGASFYDRYDQYDN